jgi:hypothetical protein
MMVIFTTTEPGFLGTAGSEPFVARRDPKIVGKWQGVYIHGKAENTAGYDIPIIVDGTLEFQPEQECVVELKNAKIECILVAWQAPGMGVGDNPIDVFRGLICSKDDAEGLAYARQCSADKVRML